MSPFNPSQTTSSTSRPGRFASRRELVVFLLCLAVGLVLVAWRAATRADAAHASARTEALARGTALELQLGEAASSAEVLGALATQSSGAIPNFQKVAADLLAAHPGLASLELQPGGVVSNVVARPGQERRLGFNVLNDPSQRLGAYAAIQRRVLTVAGPLPLSHGEPGIVARVPIFQRARDGREYFWGFVAVSMRLQDALVRAQLDGLSAKGYDYLFFAPALAQQKPVTIAARGSSSLQDAVQQTVRAGNLDFRLALKPRSGWVNKTKVAVEILGMLFVSGLLGLLVKMWEGRPPSPPRTGRGIEGEVSLAPLDPSPWREMEEALADTRRKLAHETAERKKAQEDCRTATEGVAQASPQQAQQTIREMQTRLDAAARAEKEAAAATQTRLQQEQANITRLQGRLEAALEAARETAEANAAKVQEVEANNRELKERVMAAGQAEASVAELTALLRKAQTELQRQQEASARGASTPGPEPVVPPPSEPRKPRGKKVVTPLVESPVEPSPAAAVPLVQQQENPMTVAQGDVAEVSSTNGTLHPSGPPASEVFNPTTPASEANLSGPPKPTEDPAGADLLVLEPPPTRKPGKTAERKKASRDQQMDLFGEKPATVQTLSDSAAVALAKETSMESPALPAVEPAPVSVAVAPPGPEISQAAAKEPTPVQLKTSEDVRSETPPQEQPVTAAVEAHPTSTTAGAITADLPVIEGLATSEGLAKSEGDSKRYLESLRHFAEHQAGIPERVRDALVQGNPGGAERMVETLQTAANDIGATAVESAAAALARAIQSQAEAGEIETLWADWEKALTHLITDLKPALKLKESKPKPARRLPVPPPVDQAQLRTAVNRIVPLLTDRDPGAKDCLKDNRGTFRSAFTASAYVEFEQLVKQDDFGAALEHLKSAAKRHGISA